jgi:chromosomal replication initiation ATPase DnaA
MSRGVQLPLDLGHRPALERDAFLVTPANEAAVSWIDCWPAWPAAALVLEGPPGCGKTHLASVWRARAAAGVVLGASLSLAAVPRLVDAGPALVVEAASAAPEQPLLHLYNAFAERGGYLLFTATTPPSRWGTRLADLRSRLMALPVAQIQPPDDLLIRAVLIKLFADRQVFVTTEVVDFLALRMERSFEAARQLVAAIDAAALAEQRRVTVPLARAVLQAFETAISRPAGP